MAASRKARLAELLALVERALAECPGNGRIRVALSGGCDSVVLTHLVAQSRYRVQLEVMHVHHGLSPHADAWADFCGELCRQLDLPFTCVKVSVDRKSGKGIEAAAREARYAALLNESPEVLLLAHHAGDQAETVLLNLLRGTGIAGLAGMQTLQIRGATRLLRPLLNVDRATLEAWAGERGLAWIEDESNADQSYSRNFIRHALLPAMTARFPAAGQNIAVTAEHCAEAQGLLDDLAELDWLALQENGALPVARLRTLNPARIANLIRFRLRALGWRAPDRARLGEFVRQLLTAAPDRHPALQLAEGNLRVQGRAVHWLLGP